jgi:hypothetical protein
MSTLIVLVSHLGPEAVEANVARLERVHQPGLVALCHGGQRADFDAAQVPKKVFTDDPGLRGPPATLQSYTAPLIEVYERFVAPRPDIDMVLVVEFDQVVLDRGFVPHMEALMESSGADVLGKGCCDRTGTNWWHRVRYRSDPALLAFLRAFSVREDPARLYGFLGTGFLIREAVLRRFAGLEHIEGVYNELYLPTVFHHLGFRLTDVDSLSGVYDHVRWSPPYTPDEVHELRRQGAMVVHPFKAPEGLGLETSTPEG